MPAPAAVVATVRTFFRALLTGDRELLASVSLPHPELATLTPTQPPHASVATMLGELQRLDVRADELPGDRHLVQAGLGGMVHLLVVHESKAGPRVDLRYLIESQKPDDARRTTARAFYRAMLLGDAPTLQRLAFDARGVELLAETPPPAGEHGQLAHVAAAMGLVELSAGEAFAVPNGVQFVGPRHAEMGIVVLSGLTPNGEIPFLLRQRDDEWKVIPFHFVQAAALARTSSLAP